jgi:hypothetical protein
MRSARATASREITPDQTERLSRDPARIAKDVTPLDDPKYTADNLVALLGVYTTQFGSYTTMLWQVPALGLTAQSFLLSIALGKDITEWAEIAAAALSIVIAIASSFLMRNQRGRAMNHAELAKRVSFKLSLTEHLGGDFSLADALPTMTNALDVWRVDRVIYGGWVVCMVLFVIVDVGVIINAL